MKIGYFITARLKSSRLKRKIVLPLNGDTVLDQVIRRCAQVVPVEDVVLCTSTNPQDSELYDYALRHSIKFYPGSEDDVLKRLYDAARYYGYDAFISITADNPLHSMHISKAILGWVDGSDIDFAFPSGLPIGLTPYFIRTDALEVAIHMKENSDTEIWGPFVNRPDFFRIGYMSIEHDHFPPDTRLTCDYQEDYELISAIYRHFQPKHLPTLFEISDLIKNGNLNLTNTDIIQRSVPQEELDRIRAIFDSNIENGKIKAKAIGFGLNPGSEYLNISL